MAIGMKVVIVGWVIVLIYMAIDLIVFIVRGRR